MNKKLKEMLLGIDISMIERYLSLNGWERDYSFKNLNLYSYVNQSIAKRIAITPNKNFQDFYSTLESALQTVSVTQDKSVEAVVNEINNLYFDRMEFRIVSKLSDDGKLPIKYASDCIEGLKELILYSACAEQNTQPVCVRATNLASERLSNFKLAQTNVGSFVINIDIQVIDDKNEQLTLEGTMPQVADEHKIVERIYTAISQVDDIIKNDRRITEVTEDAYRTGITANMCEALLKMRPENEEAEISATMKYSSIIPKDNQASNSVVVGTKHFLIFDEISKIYRNKELITDVILTGVIKSLAKKNEERIIQLWAVYNGRYRIIRIELSDDDYILACNAHRDDLEVEISGELDMSNKIWILSKIEYFRTL
jgi:hypothetical protein